MFIIALEIMGIKYFRIIFVNLHEFCKKAFLKVYTILNFFSFPIFWIILDFLNNNQEHRVVISVLIHNV